MRHPSILVLAVASVVVGALFWTSISAQNARAARLAKDIPNEGAWLLLTKGPVKLRGNVIGFWPLAAPGYAFTHMGKRKDNQAKQCNGEIRQVVTDDGMLLLRCMRCGKEWEIKSHASPKP